VRLYPRLRLVAARELADALASAPVETARAASAIAHPDAVPAPTGGQAATPGELADLQQLVRHEAALVGYPEPPSLVGQQTFDATVGRCLLQRMNLSPSEASHIEVWAYVGCVLLPDVVRWRFHGERTTAERFIGGARGLRNAFGRLWWRAYLLDVRETANGLVDPLVSLNEDELVQITERPGLSGYQVLASSLAHEFVRVLEADPAVPREALMRQATKRLLRTLALVSPATMEPDEVKALASEVLEAAHEALLASPIAPRRSRVSQIRTASDSIGRQIRSTAQAVTRSIGTGPRESSEPAPPDPLTHRLADLGIEVVDRRDRGGRLWVVGGEDLEPTLERLAESLGGRFVFAPNGSSSTRRRPAWYFFDSPRR